MTKAKTNGVIVLTDPMFIAQRRGIVDLALSHRIPAIYHQQNFVEACGLISYGAEYPETVSTERGPGRQDPEGREAGRSPGGGALLQANRVIE